MGKGLGEVVDFNFSGADGVGGTTNMGDGREDDGDAEERRRRS